MPATPPAGGRNPAPKRAGRAGPAGPTDRPPGPQAGASRAGGSRGGTESPLAPAIGITRPPTRDRAAASRAAHGGEGGAERKRSGRGRGGVFWRGPDEEGRQTAGKDAGRLANILGDSLAELGPLGPRPVYVHGKVKT